MAESETQGERIRKRETTSVREDQRKSEKETEVSRVQKRRTRE